ncbi:hypothetical protein HMP0721_1108 [Pseudoramibacter alactolyticus ATCC 23263]|jgi:hypothetical protein|uniref:Uncharacterized protein n=1 Tax=Pseudoramibacter alactolyticus ATCC 23263 TaxID=887929 RepID=E6MGH5_9FIRM|nr:hypothetical protein HMP0721_1108 [Pseudoramibacter alactolyticus ATCC 23263]
MAHIINIDNHLQSEIFFEIFIVHLLLLLPILLVSLPHFCEDKLKLILNQMVPDVNSSQSAHPQKYPPEQAGRFI